MKSWASLNDGPQPAGMRYCLCSAALRFIPEGKLKQEGCGEHDALVKWEVGRKIGMEDRP